MYVYMYVRTTGCLHPTPAGAIPNLKLFLPRSEVTKEPNSKKPWTFQVKHPRREGALLFAAETEEEFRRWMRAFRSAASIEVQAVANMEEIRITDLELKQKWKDYSGPQQNGGINHGVESTSSEVCGEAGGGCMCTHGVCISCYATYSVALEKLLWLNYVYTCMCGRQQRW